MNHVNHSYSIQASKRNCDQIQQKIPSPKPLADIMERSRRDKPAQLPSPRRMKYKSFDVPESVPSGKIAFF